MRTTKIQPTQIFDLLRQGLSNEEIARRVGWTVGTLRVRCSHWKISLRRPYQGRNPRRPSETVKLSCSVLGQMRQRAASMGISTTELAAALLSEIARDNLYEAVLANAAASPDATRSAAARLRPGTVQAMPQSPKWPTPPAEADGDPIQ